VNPACIEVVEGDRPLLLAQPHVGTWLPPELEARLTATGRARTDTDWQLDRLYADLLAGATVVRARFSRYLIDVNRPPDDRCLYPGLETTGLCPTTDFDGRALYLPGREPDAAECRERLERYWRPYHAALEEQLARLRRRYDHVLLYDCHSIRSRIPRLFAGRLPDLNLGANDRRSAHPALIATAEGVLAEAEAAGYTWVTDGRFKGGYTTRHYGRPETGVSALQMELAQATYMREEPPWSWLEARAARLRPLLARLLAALLETLERRVIGDQS